MYTSVLQVEWLDDEHAKQEVWGSRVGGREACVFCAKNCMTVWLPGGVSLGILLKIIPYFHPIFSGFLETTSMSVF